MFTVSYNVVNSVDNYTSILLIIRAFVYGDFLWMLLWNISVFICLVSLIISREFQKCTRDFELGFEEDAPFPCKLFHKTVERFRQLTLVVNKVDEMFSMFVGILLASTFSLIVGIIYFVVARKSFKTEGSNLMFSVLIFAVLLSSLAALHHRVRKRINLIHPFSH